ncbi:hypothetical protein RO3G_01934 [Rhizopus delemar RA 99-880]|uniref:Uncharacterized protein n=1 Tax=Rhizopus delemar (strain RA 99-880 / ATCC MYA-4621 / FGSC 9543 / NRRL 43880) TaxID=246409 RepID=I1BM00_RHIO9|nr:hypothetical protein RO3G_01934 [Rhizopus delemar RA 99-880]|eukprot:EIE77230.1 hypothetical protein RO3G_01934 [Rhizopus delemar RA 99-880]
MINRQKEIVAKSFAQNVTEWAHLKFKRPGNNQRDIYLYETANSSKSSPLKSNYLHRITFIFSYQENSLLPFTV